MSEIQSVVVVGSGTMGHGIAQVCAHAGLRVTMTDVSEAVVAKGKAQIEKSLAKLREKGRISAEDEQRTVAAISLSTDPVAASASADLIVEAVPERMDLKLDLVKKVSEAAPAHAIVATNTSSLSVTEIAGVAKDGTRVVGMHFFNPVPVMELLEIVRAMQTSEDTIASARAFAAKIGKKPIVVKDAPGFATSRLGVILGCEAIRMLEQGVASAEDIDLAMELGYRHPMGPLKLTDLVGLDVRLLILDHLHKELGEQFRPPSLLRQMVRAGRLGRKVGRGFYDYPDVNAPKK
ncbi:MAG: 3-hydroxybutyryl-CoA dehydrogenase [Sandaracinaceae bacterium]|nr:3-hydroxybutyryl-CoA dehydrogenase [Sandaracinaceae bacterium]